MVRLLPEELAAIADSAQACGRPVARFIREAALGAAPRAKSRRTSAELVRSLTQVANRLTTLAKAAHQAGRADEEVRLRVAADEIVAMIARIE
jgi:hypothetical protein